MNIIEQCRIAPPDAAEELFLPLTFFDMFWPDFFPMRGLFFYEFPCSKSEFVNKIIPNMKRSLALALKHFRPFAGNLFHPLGAGKPQLQCKNGDSVSVVFAESDDNFSDLIGNHPRNADRFYHLLAELPPAVHAAGYKLIPLLAVQVTLFPNSGASVGITNQHVVGDAATLVSFIKSWASICRLGGDAEFVENSSLHPVYDRSLIGDTDGKLAEKNWFHLRRAGSIDPPPQISLENKVRATFVVKDAAIKKLKNLAAMAMSLDSSVHHISTFTVTCGYVWTCLAKSGAAIGEEDDVVDHFFFPADYRARLDPPLSAAYFGNCLGFFFVKSPRAKLTGDKGFAAAAKLIGEAIDRRLGWSECDVLEGAENWWDELEAMDLSRAFGTAGSARNDFYGVDFGWGKARKFEVISIDVGQLVSMCRSREAEWRLDCVCPRTRWMLLQVSLMMDCSLDDVLR